MRDYRRITLENRRDAALVRRAKLIAEIAALQADTKLSKPVWVGESAEDARENHIALLREMLRDQELAIHVINEDLAG